MKYLGRISSALSLAVQRLLINFAVCTMVYNSENERMNPMYMIEAEHSVYYPMRLCASSSANRLNTAFVIWLCVCV